MKAVVIALAAFIISTAVMTTAQPIEQVIEEEPDLQPSDDKPLYQIAERSSRQTRATCDLLSLSTPIGSLNHAACAAHCLAKFQGYRGGRCINGVCNCRR